MTFTEKFANLTPEYLEKFNALKESAGLDALLTEAGLELTAEEKTKVLQYIETGKLPLADEELDNVAGGGGGIDTVWFCCTCGRFNMVGTYCGGGCGQIVE